MGNEISNRSETCAPLKEAGFQVRHQQTRVVLPFYYMRDATDQAVASLQNGKIAGKTNAWCVANAPYLYRDEVPDYVKRFLALDPDNSAGGRYLNLDGDLQNRIFSRKLQLLPSSRSKPDLRDAIRFSLVGKPGVELFLSDHGVGVLSMTFSADVGDDPGSLLEFNYRLARRHSPYTKIRIPHPADDQQEFAAIDDEAKSRIQPPPSEDAELEERLGARGGVFSLFELVDELLCPLQDHHLELQSSQFSIYTLACFGEEVDFEDPDTRQRMGPFLSALGQVIEERHAGAPSEFLGVPEAVLNRRHWAAAGPFAAAHLASDQPSPNPGDEPHPFNAQRVSRLRDKYFTPFLLAVMQRALIRRALIEASEAVDQPVQKAGATLTHLRREMMNTAVEGRFAQVSDRYPVQRFYVLVQEALGIDSAWDDVHRAVADLDSANNAERQEVILRNTGENLSSLAHMQVMVEIIEIFLVSVYSAHLWHMATDHVFSHGVVSLGCIGFAALGAAVAAFVLRPWRHRIRHVADEDEDE
jgi:hypothetical protein